MSLVDDLKKLLPFIPKEVKDNLVIFVATIIVFGIGATIISFSPLGEMMPYGDILELLVGILFTAPVLLASVFLMESMIDHRVKRRKAKRRKKK